MTPILIDDDEKKARRLIHRKILSSGILQGGFKGSFSRYVDSKF
jgi:hypothetical protein